MRIKTPGLGLIALGILLLGAQLVLYLGYKNADQLHRGEQHIQRVAETRNSPLPGIFGAISLAAGLALSARSRREADDPRDGRSIADESPQKNR